MKNLVTLQFQNTKRTQFDFYNFYHIKDTKKMTATKQTKTTKETNEMLNKEANIVAETSSVANTMNDDVNADNTVLNTLVSLYKLQSIHSQIDKVRTIRGELPLEVTDLEDVCLGLQTRLDKYKEKVFDLNKQVEQNKENIRNSQALVAKYKEQLNNVRNNREFDALSKEIEYEELDMQLCEKRNKEHLVKITEKQTEIVDLETELSNYQKELEIKRLELQAIVAETEKDETRLLQMITDFEPKVEPRMLSAFNRIRSGMRNGLATVKIERGACGGCFSKIAPQRQMDIKMHRKVIVCEFCGRILVDDEIAKIALEE